MASACPPGTPARHVRAARDARKSRESIDSMGEGEGAEEGNVLGCAWNRAFYPAKGIKSRGNEDRHR